MKKTNMRTQKDNVVVSLSGGMDSSTLLLRCLLEYKRVTAISFDYGQKHKIELERAQSLVDYINNEFKIMFKSTETHSLE
jgi:7-cyano-7-deazaguanine synthase